MLSKYVQPGIRVELIPKSRKEKMNGEGGKKVYQSKVYDILSEDELEILMPMEKAKLILLPIGGEYEMFFYTSHGLYRCEVRVRERYKSNNVYILSCELTSSLGKYQRREYYRLNCAMEMQSRLLEEEELWKLDQARGQEEKGDIFLTDLPLKKSMIVDISGGGVRFVAGTAYEKDAMLYFRYSLNLSDGVREFEMAGKVLSVKEMENKSGYYEHRLEFVEISEEEREEIIKFIFEEERKQRKRERGKN